MGLVKYIIVFQALSFKRFKPNETSNITSAMEYQRNPTKGDDKLVPYEFCFGRRHD